MSNEVENNQASEPIETGDAPQESLQDAPKDSSKSEEVISETAKPTSETAEPTPETAEPTPETTEPTSETAEPTSETAEPTPETAEPTSEAAEPAQSNNDSNKTVITEELINKIIRQIEYYFGDYNLPRDKFLKEQVKLDDGWVSLDTMVKFKRLRDLTTDHEVIRNALKKSSLMEIDDLGNKIRRSPNIPLPYSEDPKAEAIKRTVYCKGLPKDGSVNLDILLEHFKEYGPFDTIQLRQFVDKQTKKMGFKGSILIVFHTEEKAKEFMDIDDIKFKGMPLLRKWHQDYLEQKEEEIKERQARKKARLAKFGKGGANENILYLNDYPPIERGSFVFASGFTGRTTREDIKAAFSTYPSSIAFISLSKGDTSGYIRFTMPFCNKNIVETMDGKVKVNDALISLRLVEGEEEEQQIKLAEDARRNKCMVQCNRKRKAAGGRGGRFNKRRRF